MNSKDLKQNLQKKLRQKQERKFHAPLMYSSI